jgi:hypothetical protein
MILVVRFESLKNGRYCLNCVRATRWVARVRALTAEFDATAESASCGGTNVETSWCADDVAVRRERFTEVRATEL